MRISNCELLMRIADFKIQSLNCVFSPCSMLYALSGRSSNLMPRQRSNDKCETGDPLVVDAACGAGLSGLFRRSFNED